LVAEGDDTTRYAEPGFDDFTGQPFKPLTYSEWLTANPRLRVPDMSLEELLADNRRIQRGTPDPWVFGDGMRPGPMWEWCSFDDQMEAYPRFVAKAVEEHRAYGNVPVTFPDGHVTVYRAGTPRHYIDDNISPFLDFASYEEWKAANVYQWPTTKEGQEEARRRTEAMWSTRPDPYWSALEPPYYFIGYRTYKPDHREYFKRFVAERAALGDTVLQGQKVYAIGTPEWVLDKERARPRSGPPPLGPVR
jgi:hypothetical protein